MIAIIGLVLFAVVVALCYWVVRNHPSLKFLLTVFFICCILIVIKIFWQTDKHSQFFDSFWKCDLQATEVTAIKITSNKCVCETAYTDSVQIAKILGTLCNASQIPFEIADGGSFNYYNLKIEKRDHTYISVSLTTEMGSSYTRVKLHAPNSDASAEKQSTDIAFALKDVLECEGLNCADKF